MDIDKKEKNVRSCIFICTVVSNI